MKTVTHPEDIVCIREDEDFRYCESSHGAYESAFEALSEIESKDRLSIREDECKSNLTVQADFSSYNFWTSKSESMHHCLDLSETFPHCDSAVTPDHDSSPVADLDGWRPEILPGQIAHPNYRSACSSTLENHAGITVKENCFWDFPLELEEDIFEATTDWNTLTAGIQELQEGNETTDEYLVEDPHGSGPVCPGNSDSMVDNLLVYAPSRYIEEAPCIFHSTLEMQTEHCDAEEMKSRIHLEDRSRRRKRGQRGSFQGRRSIFKRRTLHILDSPVLTLNAEVLAEVDTKEPRETFENADHLNNVHNRRRRLRTSAQGTKSAKLMASDKPIVNDRSPTPVARIRKTNSVWRMMNPDYCSDSPPESSLTFRTSNHRFSFSGKKEHLEHTLDTVPPKSYDDLQVKESYKQFCDNVAVRTSNSMMNHSLKNLKRAESETHVNPVSSMKKIDYKSQLKSPERPISKLTTSPRHSPVENHVKKSSHDSPVIRSFKRSPRDCLKIRKFWRDSAPTPPNASNFLGTSKCGKRSEVPICQQSASEPPAGTTLLAKRLVRLKRTPLPKNSVAILQEWLNDNRSMPYPSRVEKDELQLRTGLQMSQIENWLGNARQKLRILKKTSKGFSDSESSPEHPMRRVRRKRSR